MWYANCVVCTHEIEHEIIRAIHIDLHGRYELLLWTSYQGLVGLDLPRLLEFASVVGSVDCCHDLSKQSFIVHVPLKTHFKKYVSANAR